MAFLGQEEQIRELQDRFRYLYAVVFIGLGILLSRMIFLQVLNGEKYREASENNRIKRVKIAAPRGMIFDRNHKLLIDNRPAFDLEIIPQYLHESKQSNQVIALLSRIIKLSQDDIREALKKAGGQASFMPVKIKTDLERDEVAEIESWKLEMPGVQIQQEIKRTNIYGDIASHMLGYVGETNASELPRLNKDTLRYKLGDNIGKSGLEQRLEDTLRGVDGEKLVEVDALGRIKQGKNPGRVLATELEKPAAPGKNLILTIDQDLQTVAAQAFGDKIGSIVAIDPRNGQILAMVSRPSYDPTAFSRGIPPALWHKLITNENRPLFDKTIQDHYSPGSTFKVVTAIAGLEEGAIDEHTTFNCSGSMRVGNRVYHCHKKGGHGTINVVTALTVSCDVFFYRTALKLHSVDDIAKWAMHLGLGKKTGINLAHETSGLIPTEEWKQKRYHQQWNAGETVSVAIGQSYVLVTALQLANAYASIANGGTLYKPYLVKEVETFEGQVLEQFKPEILDQTRLSPKTYELVKQGMWGTVNSPHGTGYHNRLPGMDMLGKTGTVQIMKIAADKIYQKCENMKFKDRHHGVFAGFAPAKNPVIAIAVVGEHVCHGGTGAMPIGAAVVKAYLEKFDPKLYSPAAIALRSKEEKFGLTMPKADAVEPDPEGITVNEDDETGPQTDESLPTPLLPPPAEIPAGAPSVPGEQD